MDHRNKLKQLEKNFDQIRSELPEIPDFESMNEDQLNDFIISWQNKFHYENKINSFTEAERRLKWELDRGLIPEKDYEAIIHAERVFWEKAANSESELMFIDDIDKLSDRLKNK